MQKQIDNIEAKVDRIHEAITGEVSGKGLASRLKDLEDYQTKDRKHKWMGLGGALVLGTIAKYWDKFTHLF